MSHKKHELDHKNNANADQKKKIILYFQFWAER